MSVFGSPLFLAVSFHVITGSSSQHSIWIVGDSLVHWGSVYAERLGCLDLGLQATVSWWGKRGLNLRACSHLLRNIAHQQPAAPSILLIHVGSNDVGMVNKKHLMEMILNLIHTVHSLFPQTTLIWSDIIPRVYYAGVSKRGQCKVDKTRRAANKYARSQTVRRRGHAVQHPDIRYTSQLLFRKDGIHLSDAGNSILLINFRHILGSMT